LAVVAAVAAGGSWLLLLPVVAVSFTLPAWQESLQAMPLVQMGQKWKRTYF